MLSALRKFMRFCGIFRFKQLQRFQPKLLQILINAFVIGSVGSFMIASVIYSIKYQDTFNTIKSAGYSTNTMFIVYITYIYLLFTRSELWSLLEAWEKTIRNSCVINFLCKFCWLFMSCIFFLSLSNIRNKSVSSDFIALCRKKGSNHSSFQSGFIECNQHFLHLCFSWCLNTNFISGER